MDDKNKGGRPSHEPTESTRKQVESMAGYGIPEADIALSLEISAPTLRKHYRRELDMGHIKANSAIAQSLFKKATGDGSQAVTAAIFWAKTRMGWKETIINEHSGGVNLKHSLTDMTDEELAAIATGSSTGITGKA